MRFDSYHPAINLIYFASAIGFTIWFDHPVYVGIAFAVAFAYSVKLKGLKGLVFNACLIPLAAAWALWYSYYTHFGVTVIGQNFTGNDMTLESLVFGVIIGVRAAAVIMWMSCVFELFTSDKVVYLFGKVSPRLSLFLSIGLRGVPRIKDAARKINPARCGIGRGCGQGNLFARLRNCAGVVSIVITWALEDFLQSSMSMKSRGYLLKGRTAFSIYRFDNRDRSLVLGIFLCLTFVMMAVMFNQVTILYDPEIIMNRITWASYVFYCAYAVLLMLSLGLQVKAEIAFGRQRKLAETD